ncbi:MAG TPA: hypothetical protein VIV06_04265 [Candidatus Limnocylindrales bacterium]
MTGSAHPVRPRPQPAHVIEEYRHRAQTITCTCGWHGSCASPDGRTSDWKTHLAEMREKRPEP